MPDEFLTVQEVAEFLRVDPQTVYNWIERGEIAGVRVGKRRVRIRQADLDAFVAAGSQPTAQSEGQEPADTGSDSTDADTPTVEATARLDSDSTDADSPPVEATDGLEGLDRAEIVEALDALSQAVQTLADRLR